MSRLPTAARPKPRVVLYVTAVLALLAGPGFASPADWPWGNLEAGPNKIGFQTIDERDPSRTYGPKYDAEGNPRAGGDGRPILISVWYPARSPDGSPRMPFARYVHLLAPAEPPEASERRFRAKTLTQGGTEETVRALLQHETAAILNAPPQPGAFPVVVVGQGLYFESPLSHVALGEYLASHGYVVATCPLVGAHSPVVNLDLIDLETQVRDLEFVRGRVRSFPNADSRRLGVVGFDLGGMAASIMAQRNTGVDAMVSLDSGILFAHNLELLRQSPYHDPHRFPVPLLHATRTAAENRSLGLVEDLDFFAPGRYADTFLLRLPGMRHADFTSFAMIEHLLPGAWGTGEGDPRVGYEALCRMILRFLDAYVNADRRGPGFLQQHREDSESFHLQFFPGIGGAFRLPAGEGDFVNLIFTEGVEAAIRGYRDLRLRHPGVSPLPEEMLNRLGYHFLYSRQEPDAAIGIFSLATEIYLQSANAYDSLAEGYLVQGNHELAVANYRRSLELDPENENAAGKLKELQR